MNKFILNEVLKTSSYFVGNLKLSEIRLDDNSLYKWIILIPRIYNVVELIDLNEVQQIQLLGEINLISHALKKLYNPYKLNIATFGNVVRQFHIHIICRFEDDATFPETVWSSKAHSKKYNEKEAQDVVLEIKQILYLNE